MVIKLRLHPWVDTRTGDRHYGIQAKIDGDTRYRHCCEGSTPLVYKDQAVAKAKLAELHAKAQGAQDAKG